MSDTLNTKSAGDMVSLTATDGHVLDAYVARPEGHPRGALVVAQDAYGVGTYIRSVCDSYAADGYVAVAPATTTASSGAPCPTTHPSRKRVRGSSGPGSIGIRCWPT